MKQNSVDLRWQICNKYVSLAIPDASGEGKHGPVDIASFFAGAD